MPTKRRDERLHLPTSLSRDISAYAAKKGVDPIWMAAQMAEHGFQRYTSMSNEPPIERTKKK